MILSEDMEIHLDYNPSNHIPKNHFFISVHRTKKRYISFDKTIKGHRIIEQILIEEKRFPKNKKPTSKWKTLVIKNKKVTGEYSVKWIDLDKKDWVNDEIWETTREKSISKRLTKKLLFYSQLISDNYKNLKKFGKEMEEFEKVLKTEIERFE
jgi:hypothetical protein